MYISLVFFISHPFHTSDDNFSQNSKTENHDKTTAGSLTTGTGVPDASQAQHVLQREAKEAHCGNERQKMPRGSWKREKSSGEFTMSKI